MKLFKFIILFSFLLITNNLFSQVLNGLIVDQNGEPLEQVSIYLKNNPVYGSATSSDGNFKIDFDEAKLKNRDEIVFSYIGYKTVYIKVSDLRWDTLKVTLIEQPIVLNEASITAKVSKKQLTTINENKLMILKKQLYKTFHNKYTF